MLTSSSRYKVTVVAAGTDHLVLVVPFQPDALVTALVDELSKRIARQGLQLQPDTHVATLHLDSETGAILDYEDLLSAVVGDDEREKLFLVLRKKEAGVSPDVEEPMQIQASVSIPSRR